MTCINTGHMKSYDQLDAEDRAVRLGNLAMNLVGDCQAQRLPVNHAAWARAREWLRQAMRLRQVAALPPSRTLDAFLSACSTPGHSAKDLLMNDVNPRLSPIAPSVGRIVLLTLPSEHPRAGEIRPAMVVRVNGELSEVQSLNLAVLLDGPNDMESGKPVGTILWLGSRNYDATGQCGTWRWMDYQMGQAEKTNKIQAQSQALIDEAMVAMGLRIVRAEATSAETVNRLLDLEKRVAAVAVAMRVPSAQPSVDPAKATPAAGLEANNQADQVGGPDASAPKNTEPDEPRPDHIDG